MNINPRIPTQRCVGITTGGPLSALMELEEQLLVSFSLEPVLCETREDLHLSVTPPYSPDLLCAIRVVLQRSNGSTVWSCYVGSSGLCGQPEIVWAS